MNLNKNGRSRVDKAGIFGYANLILIFISILTLVSTFLITNSRLDFQLRSMVFTGVVSIYLIVCCLMFYASMRQRRDSAVRTGSGFSEEVKNKVRSGAETKLEYLDAANFFIARSIKPSEIFQLITIRLGEILKFESCRLFLENGNEGKIKIEYASDQQGNLLNTQTENDFGNVHAEKVFRTGKSSIVDLDTTINSINPNISAAFPLFRDNMSIYGVIEINADKQSLNVEDLPNLINEFSRRISPLILKSLAFERDLENSLTDGLTKLPNERAFYLILENQIAESQRFRESRPLTLLNIDIKNFDEINRNYGHVTGDRVLSWSAQIIKSQLRQMDFLSKFNADEFLAILPTASEEIAKVIIERIENAFRQNPFGMDANSNIQIELNFGAATFVKDGETAEELLSSATLKKQISKSPAPNQVLIFPRQLAN